MDIYAQNILDHYKNPRNQGSIKNPSLTHKESNTTCGDSIEIDLKIVKDSVKDLKFRGEGCAISQAAISILSEYIIGKKIKDIEKMEEREAVTLLGIEVSERRRYCATLGFLAVKKALKNFKPSK